jgi:hypothetical protein
VQNGCKPRSKEGGDITGEYLEDDESQDRKPMIGGVEELLSIAPASSLAGSYSRRGDRNLGKTPSDTSSYQMMRGNKSSVVAKLLDGL